MGDMFQHKIDEIFNDIPNVFGIVDDTLAIGYDNGGTDHDAMVHKVLQRCEEVNDDEHHKTLTDRQEKNDPIITTDHTKHKSPKQEE